MLQELRPFFKPDTYQAGHQDYMGHVSAEFRRPTAKEKKCPFCPQCPPYVPCLGSGRLLTLRGVT